jgi:nuclease-like protein
MAHTYVVTEQEPSDVAGEVTAEKLIELRYASRCSRCGAALPKRASAWHDPIRRKVRCESCPPPAEPVAVPEVAPAQLESGVAGASAQREGERRHARRAVRVEKAIAADAAWRADTKQRHPVLGRIATSLTPRPAAGPDPQHIKAWATGADGERVVGQHLDIWGGEAPGRHVLHDRRIPGTRRNIDHLAIGPTGVWVIDAKQYAGKVELVTDGTLFHPVTKLRVGGRNQSHLAAGVQDQIARVAAALQQLDGQPLTIHGMLCFVGAQWGLFAKPFLFDSLTVAWPSAAVDILSRHGPVLPEHATRAAELLARCFPNA